MSLSALLAGPDGDQRGASEAGQNDRPPDAADVRIGFRPAERPI